MVLLISKVDGDILTGSNWQAIRSESNPVYFGNANSGNVVLTGNLTVSSDWDVTNLTLSGAIVVTLNSGKRIRVSDTLTFWNAAGEIRAGACANTVGSRAVETNGGAGRAGNGGSGGGFIGVFCTNLSGAGLITANGQSGTLPVVGNTSTDAVGLHGANGSPMTFMGLWTSGNYSSSPTTGGGAGRYGSGGGIAGANGLGGSGGVAREAANIRHANDLFYFLSMPLSDLAGTGGGGGGGRVDGASSNNSVSAGGGGGGGAFIGSGGRGGDGNSGTNATQNKIGGFGGGGGGAGGCLLFVARNFLGTPTTVLQANGGDGTVGGSAVGSATGGGGGGGGGGGLIVYWAPSALTAFASGGAGAMPGPPNAGGRASFSGTEGAVGRVAYMGAFG